MEDEEEKDVLLAGEELGVWEEDHEDQSIGSVPDACQFNTRDAACKIELANTNKMKLSRGLYLVEDALSAPGKVWVCE